MSKKTPAKTRPRATAGRTPATRAPARAAKPPRRVRTRRGAPREAAPAPDAAAVDPGFTVVGVGGSEARRAHADLVRRMLTLQEAERQRIARDIHDDLGQPVTALRLKLEWLAGVLGGHDDLLAAVASVQEAARKVDQHIDFLLRDLRPAGLDELGLVTVLRQAVEDWSATFGIKALFQTSGLEGVRFPRDVEMQSFRIVQEALNNVHKHAAATSVDVILERKHGRTALTVEDDGIGLLASSTGGRRGLGLLGMRERATVIGGELDVTSMPGRGTKVTLLLP